MLFYCEQRAVLPSDLVQEQIVTLTSSSYLSQLQLSLMNVPVLVCEGYSLPGTVLTLTTSHV
jgi:hypothetical protein